MRKKRAPAKNVAAMTPVEYRLHRTRIVQDCIYRHQYGLTWEQVQRMKREREGRCDICKVQPARSLHIDHDHETGQVRGLLCMACNIALGKFRDSPELLRRAAQYLEKHRA